MIIKATSLNWITSEEMREQREKMPMLFKKKDAQVQNLPFDKG